MDSLKKLLILAIVGAAGAGAFALIERLMFEAPRPALSGEPPALIPKKPAERWNWRLT
ncbi:hypothetical protein [Mesorhizobium sp.]|uniref:hypothetical protein n=1 Tax=Mesorhizobium sp. TaxID=1871066 RepID=UPI0025BAE65F|nr:hypothetical protein [Mesorhizobium sp.]